MGTRNHLTNNRKLICRYRPTDRPNGKDYPHPNIIIRPADKGSKIVIMDRQQYIIETNRQLSDTIHCKSKETSTQTQTQLAVRNIIQSLYHKKIITSKQKGLSICPRHFYLLPKIHKEPQTWTIPYEGPSGRPIVSDCNSATYKISEYIEHFLGPLSTKHPSYIRHVPLSGNYPTHGCPDKFLSIYN